ncbi:MAG: PA14 domain-containing protein [Chthoniobacteraceae bacterium]
MLRRLSTLLLSIAVAGFGTAGQVRAQQYGLNSRPSFTAYNGTLPTTAPTFSGSWSAVQAFPNVTFINALGITQMPGTNNMVVWEREGRVYFFDKAPSTSSKTLALDISNRCQGWDDSGLLALAFHPNFGTGPTNNRYVFLYYTWVTPGTVAGSATSRPPTFTPCRDRLARFTVNLDGTIDPNSETIFIDQVSASIWHNGGGMFFHPANGFLYLTNGDDAQSSVNTQIINRGLYSGVLRIDVDQRGGGISHPIPRLPQPAGSVAQNYYIPNDNPFVGQSGVLEEFFSIGLRSPHRMTCDPVTGRIFIGDVGLANWEEIDVIGAGESALNFQWDRFEGSTGDLTQPFIGTNRRPAISYSHSEGSAVIGGYVYRGTEFAADLGGKYIFGDNGTGTVWYLDESTTPATKVALAQLPNGGGPSSGSNYVGLSSFGVDADNELYLCQMSSSGGKIFKLSRTGTPPPALPATLSATGLMSNLATLTPNSGFTAYDVINPLWSDRADKKRWFGVPTGQQIGYAATGDWAFPNGSVFLKHFDLPIDDNNPAIKKRLETRVLVRNADGYVYGMTYKWRADHSDADLITSGVTEDVAITGSVSLGTLTSTDIGGPSAGATAGFNGGYAVTAGGTDIFGTSDQFRFVHTQKTGDFDIAARLESLDRADLYTKAGLMARESLAANSRNVMALVFPTNEARNNNTGGYEFQSRDTNGGASAAIYPASPQPAVRYPNAWLRLKRAGNDFTAYHSRDGVNWTLYATKTLALPGTIYFGMAVTSHSASTQTTARFHFNIDRTQPWYFPGRQDCLTCHTNVSTGVLGVNTQISNLQRVFAETGVNDNQLRAWNHAGYLDTGLSESAFEATIPGLTKMAALGDTGATVEHRMRSYLDSNCAHCHRPGGVHAFWDARLETPLGSAGIVNGIVQETFGTSGAKVLVPDSVDQSMMYKRMATATETHKMPPLAKNLVDQSAIAMLEAWIAEVVQPPADPLPSPWLHTDIGSVGFAGDATYQTSSGTFITSASGADIEGNSDAFHFTYQPLTGDGEIVARVQSLSATDPYTKAGVMIRETLDSGSKNAFTTLMSAHGSQLQWRTATNGGTSYTDGPDQFAPYYVRIRRQGDVLTGYIASTPGAWTQVGSTTIAMSATAYIGLAVTAHNNTQTATALFDNVSVSSSGLALALHLNFQPAGAPIPDGYLADTGATYGARGNGFTYGWSEDNTAFARDRNNAASPDQRYDTFNHMKHSSVPTARTWEIAVPNGTYSVHLVCGDPLTTDSTHVVTAEGGTFLSGTPTAQNPFIEATANVTVTDGTLTLAQGAGGSNTKLSFIEISSVASAVNVTLNSPAHLSTHYGAAAASIAFAANANTTTGGATITQVEFFDGFISIGTDTSPPFEFTWTTASAGAHSVMAKATDSTSAIGFTAFNEIFVSADGPLGLDAEYWPNLTMSGTPQTRADANIQFDWAQGSPMAGIPNDNFSVRWRGRIKPQFTETYTFRTETDDGVRLWVNGQLIIDKWVNQGTTSWNGNITLNAGQLYEFEMHYFDNFGDAVARLFWSSASQAEQIVPGTVLFAPAGGTNHRPRTPVVTLPSVDGELADPSGIVMQTAAFQDVDAGQTHAATDWEIWTTSGTIERAWKALNATGTNATLGSGTFEPGFTALANETAYQLRVRHKDNSGAANSEWSAYGLRNFTTSTSALPTGISGEYYPNDTSFRLVGTPLTRTDTTIDFGFGGGELYPGAGNDNFSVRWRARVRPQFSETYTFTTRTDDGARLWVNGQLLVDQWIGQAATEVSGTITLVAGQYYDLEMHYFDGAFDGEARLFWASASQPKQIIPATRLHQIAGGANHRPLVPLINLPTGATAVSAASLAMQSGAFADQDAGHTHAATDWEVWTTVATPQRVWSALNQTGAQLLDATLADGAFEGALAGRATLDWGAAYQLRVRHKDSSADANSEWSAKMTRNFTTTASPLSVWRTAEFTAGELADPQISGDAADPDHDGMNNFGEFVFRLPPKSPGASPVAISSLDVDAIFLDFPVNVAAEDVTYWVETSPTLGTGTWTSSGITYEVLSTAGGVRNIRARIPRSGAQQFVRARATSP